jgi:uncharacterized protein DUF3562
MAPTGAALLRRLAGMMDGRMHAEREESTHRDVGVEFLAKESNVPVDDVARLYENEVTRIGFGARILHFVPIFALRNVREMLRRRTKRKTPGATDDAGA